MVIWYSLIALAAGLVACSAEKKLTDTVKTSGARPVVQVEISGAITPSTMETLEKALEEAKKRDAAALLVLLNTPGGLMHSMDEMCRKILNSPVPVITYVYPPGAYAGSAGVYIMYASHLAAMAPATNIGSATPVQMGGGGAGDKKESGPKTDRIPDRAGSDDGINMKRKLFHHAQAQIRSFAEFHGRNPTFAERTITHAENITSTEAFKTGAIELVASSPQELLEKAHGRTVRLIGGRESLNLKDLPVEKLESDFRSEFLKIITNPVVVNLLMMIGVLGILGEVQYPGSIFPGAIGAICLLLGLYAMQQLPVNYAGVALIGLGVIFFLLEIKIVSYGMLSLAGTACLLIGSILLAKDAGELLWSSLATIIATTAAVAGIIVVLMLKAAKVMRSEKVKGMDTLDGMLGEALSEITAENGRAFVHSEIWAARSEAGSIPKGAPVRVVRREGLTFFVEPDDGSG